MSAAAPKPNGVPNPEVPVQVPARSAKETKPKLMQELEVEYWMNQPLEHIERMMARRDPTDRVFFAILRCSLCPPFLSPVALRPRLRSGDFPEWVERLRRRQREKRAFQPGELNDETFDTDKAGKKVPLRPTDLAAITGLAKQHLYQALKELRESGLVEDRKGEYRIAKPKAAPPRSSLTRQVPVQVPVRLNPFSANSAMPSEEKSPVQVPPTRSRNALYKYF